MSEVTRRPNTHRTLPDMPEWMVPGAQFLDADGGLCVYLGFAGWRENKPVQLLVSGVDKEPVVRVHRDHDGALYMIELQKPEHIFCYRYKGEWHMTSFERYFEDGGSWSGFQEVTNA